MSLFMLRHAVPALSFWASSDQSKSGVEIGTAILFHLIAHNMLLFAKTTMVDGATLI